MLRKTEGERDRQREREREKERERESMCVYVDGEKENAFVAVFIWRA